MDIGDIIKDYFWVIIALIFYLLFGRKKTKKDGKIVPESGKQQVTVGEPKLGLQERLEKALREMQQQVEQGNTTRPVQSSAPAQQMSEMRGDVVSIEEGFYEASTSNSFEFHTTVPLHQRKTALESVPVEVVQEVSGEALPEFHEAHGLRYHSHSGEMKGGRELDFHEVHGMHYGESLTSPSRSTLSAVLHDESSALFRDEEDVRRAIIAAEILGPPKGMRVA